ncbi:MAG: PIG-L deacetylase family protein [Victivallaceae bacterium]
MELPGIYLMQKDKLAPMSPSKSKILVLAPHPDDFDAIAVTLKFFHERQSEIFLAVICPAWSGVEESFAADSSKETRSLVREAEQRQSIQQFGLSPDRVSFLRLTEDEHGKLLDLPENYQQVKHLLESYRPELVFMPHWNDSNSDHRFVAAMFEHAVAELSLSLTAWFNLDPKTIDMNRQVYTVFDSILAEWKAALLRCHASQHQRNLNTRGHGFDERILAGNRANGAPINAPFAEVFEIKKYG